MFFRSVRQLLFMDKVVPSSPIVVTLMREAIRSSVTSVITRAARRNIPEYEILLQNIDKLMVGKTVRLRRYVIIRKAADLTPDEMNDYYKFT
jgi:hypothetical protein